MFVAGVDIGSLSANAVIMDDDRILSWSNILTGPDSEGTGWSVIGEALRTAGLRLDDVKYTVSTGYGRLVMPFAQSSVTEISCHARGTHWFFPQVRTILDMGGQDCKAIRCDDSGKMVNFLMNDKCAAGTGRYLERIAATVRVRLDEVGQLSLAIVDEPAQIESFCSVYAQLDVMVLLREGKHINDILAGACDALTRRIVTLLERITVEADFSISGGVAKNIGVVKRLENRLGLKAYIAFEPQIVGALGAALFARDRLLADGYWSAQGKRTCVETELAE